MDDKFRASFYPSDASKIREISFSRKVGILLVALLVPLSLGGFWLSCTGAVREDENTGRIRAKLVRENNTLKGKTSGLEREMAQIRSQLDELEGEKINLALLSGLENLQGREKEKENALFTFFRSFTPSRINESEALSQAQSISSFFDSALVLLEGNPAHVSSLPTGLPTQSDALLIRGYGYFPDPFTGRKAMHEGLDFSHGPGSPVYATGGGLVTWARKDPIWGYCIRLEHAPGIHTFYAHLEDLQVRQGQRVARGEQIATIGSSGVSSGAHLHYELVLDGEKVDPLTFLLPSLQIALESTGDKERI